MLAWGRVLIYAMTLTDPAIIMSPLSKEGLGRTQLFQFRFLYYLPWLAQLAVNLCELVKRNIHCGCCTFVR